MKTRIWLALLVLYISWGSTYLATHYAVETIPPFFMAGIRYLIAGVVLYTWRRLAGDPAPTRSQWRSAAIIGLFLMIGGIGIVAWAQQLVPSGITALIVAVAPLWVVIIDAVRPGGVRPTWQTTAGLLIGLAGIAILADPTKTSASQPGINLMGVLALVFGALLWAIGTIINRGADLPESSLLGSGMEMLTGSVGLFVMGFLTGDLGRLNLAAISTRSVEGLIYLIIVGSLVGFVSYSWLVRSAPTPLVMTYAYVNPLVAVLLGGLLAQEVLTSRVLIAMPLILSSIALTNLKRTKVTQPVPERVAVFASAGED